jgi:hypothetical protein
MVQVDLLAATGAPEILGWRRIGYHPQLGRPGMPIRLVAGCATCSTSGGDPTNDGQAVANSLSSRTRLQATAVGDYTQPRDEFLLRHFVELAKPLNHHEFGDRHNDRGVQDRARCLPDQRLEAQMALAASIKRRSRTVGFDRAMGE